VAAAVQEGRPTVQMLGGPLIGHSNVGCCSDVTDCVGVAGCNAAAKCDGVAGGRGAGVVVQ
jgi:hypothetical protein